MKKWNLVVDVAECHNCNNCFISAKDEYIGNEFPGYSAPQPLHGHQWIKIESKERGRFPVVDVAYLVTTCNHCDDAPCVKAGRGAVTKRDDGIVIFDPKAVVGRRDLVDACPYGAVWWNEELNIPQIWPFDAHLLDRGADAPRCVKACPTGAITALKVSDEEMAQAVKEGELQVLRPELNTKPRVWYKNLHRYTKSFVAGQVLVGGPEGTECAAGAQVDLFVKKEKIASATTDAFGDFLFDGLEYEQQDLWISVNHKNCERRDIRIEPSPNEIVLDEIVLTPCSK